MLVSAEYCALCYRHGESEGYCPFKNGKCYQCTNQYYSATHALFHNHNIPRFQALGLQIARRLGELAEKYEKKRKPK